MKKFLALVLALVMTMSLVTVGASAKTDFTDDAKITNAEAVEVLNAMGVLTGYPDGSFRPEGILTRGAGAKIIAYLVLGQKAADKLQATYTVFEDVTDTVGLAAYIEWAAANGIVDGYGDGNFGPYNKLTEYAFGKMLLTALGYDSKEEGFTGAGWQKNVYTLAVRNKIFDGSESYAACTRDTAARMAFGAIQAELVAYGSEFVGGKYVWNGHTFTGNYGVVEGAVKLGKTLGDLYGVAKKAAYDIFDRPGHTWSYKTWSKFYMDAPVAEYTTAVSKCNLLVDCGIAKLSKANMTVEYVSANGVIASTADADYNHKNCASTTIGDQGVLTQVFDLGDEYAITMISTYLAKVEATTAGAHSLYGAEAKLSVYVQDADLTANNNAVTVWVEDAGLVKGDYVLINWAKNAVNEDDASAANYVDYTVDHEAYTDASRAYTYVNVVGAPATFEGKMTALTNHLNGTVSRTVEGKVYADAAEYELGYVPAVKTNYTWFLDQYGNLIGNADFSVASHKYGRIDALKWYNDGLVNTKEFASANLVTAEGTAVTETAVELAKWNVELNQYNVQQNAALNAGYYNDHVNNYGVVEYSEVDGVYTATTAGEVLWTNGEVSSKKVELGVALNGFWWAPQATAVYADDETQFLVLTGYTATGAEIYEAFVGIANLKTMTNVSAVVAVVEEAPAAGVKAYADFVYIDAHNALYAGASAEAYVFSGNSVSYDAVSGLYTYVIWVNGVKTEIKSEKADLFAGFSAGIYHIDFNLAGNATLATKCTKCYETETVANVGANAIDDWYVAGTTFYVIGANEITAGSIADVDAGDTLLVKAVAGSSVKVADTIYITNGAAAGWGPGAVENMTDLH